MNSHRLDNNLIFSETERFTALILLKGFDSAKWRAGMERDGRGKGISGGGGRRGKDRRIKE
ncbi:MAG: hypothetical protein H8E87_02635 [FCB group bacterium]|nr:hypothetical protein [FCB group bacterium]